MRPESESTRIRVCCQGCDIHRNATLGVHSACPSCGSWAVVLVPASPGDRAQGLREAPLLRLDDRPVDRPRTRLSSRPHLRMAKMEIAS